MVKRYIQIIHQESQQKDLVFKLLSLCVFLWFLIPVNNQSTEFSTVLTETTPGLILLAYVCSRSQLAILIYSPLNRAGRVKI